MGKEQESRVTQDRFWNRCGREQGAPLSDQRLRLLAYSIHTHDATCQPSLCNGPCFLVHQFVWMFDVARRKSSCLYCSMYILVDMHVRGLMSYHPPPTLLPTSGKQHVCNNPAIHVAPGARGRWEARTTGRLEVQRMLACSPSRPLSMLQVNRVCDNVRREAH